MIWFIIQQNTARGHSVYIVLSSSHISLGNQCTGTPTTVSVLAQRLSVAWIMTLRKMKQEIGTENLQNCKYSFQHFYAFWPKRHLWINFGDSVWVICIKPCRVLAKTTNQEPHRPLFHCLIECKSPFLFLCLFAIGQIKRHLHVIC